MKKIFTIIAVASFAVAANAESLEILHMGNEDPQPQLMGQGISPNGRYVCGPFDEAAGIFVFDLQTGDYTLAPSTDPEFGAKLVHVSDNGIAIGYNGPGILYNIEGVETLLELPDPYYIEIIGEDISADGSVMVGELEGPGYRTYPAYSKNGGPWKLLPMPEEEDMGDYASLEGKASYISGDGKYILGSVGHMGPATLWVLNDEGEYEVDPIYLGHAMLSADDDKDFLSFAPAAISDNGQYVLIQAKEFIDGKTGPLVPVIYDTVYKTYTVYSEPQEVDDREMGLFPISICNDGTFIGLVGSSQFAYTNSFIMRPDATQAELFIDAFPKYADIFQMLDIMGYHMPIDMSADGRYILGYGFYTKDANDPDDPAYWITYVLDTAGKDAVEEISAADATVRDYFTIDGIRRSTPVKGLNIIRLSDGTTRKAIL